MDLRFENFYYHKNLSGQRRLFADAFPETRGDKIQEEEHYLWKFHSIAYNPQSWEYVVYLEDEMAGYYAALPYKYRIGEQTVTAGMVCDVMTGSKFRGKGIFAKLGKYSTDDLSGKVPFLMGYPIRQEVIPGHLKIGWKIAFQLPLYIKFIDLTKFLETKRLYPLKGILNTGLNLYNHIFSTKVSGRYSGSVYHNINEITGYDLFSVNYSKSIRNFLIKDSSFARWRYGAPGRDYKFISMHNSDEMVGFIAFRKIYREEIPCYGILDYMVLPGHDRCHGNIYKLLQKEAIADNVQCFLTMMSRKSAMRCFLRKNGFLRSPFVFKLIIKNLTNRFPDEELFNEDHWHLMWVDSDDL